MVLLSHLTIRDKVETVVHVGEENEDTQETPVVSVQGAARMVTELIRQFGFKNNKPEIMQQVKFDRIKKSKQSTITNFAQQSLFKLHVLLIRRKIF